MRRLQLPSDGRPLALALLLALLLVVYFVAVHWWFVAPQLSIAGQMSDLREQQQRFAGIVAQRDEIQKRIAKLQEYERSNQAFLPQSDPAGAAAELIQRVTEVINTRDPDGARCATEQTTPLPQNEGDEPYRRVSVRIRLSCDLEPLIGILYDLEEGKPFLFIDELMIYQRANFYQRQKASSRLQAQFTLTGYLRQPGGKP